MRRLILVAALTAGVVPGVYTAAQSTDSLKNLSVDQLLDIQITSVSKRAESLSDAPASVYVITSDDIRRSGATTLPEALRLAPNLQIARADSVQYAISARGFNNAIGNKLLVLIDGRTIYTPLFSGVFWDQQEVMLEDIDRIEIISGPGATLWGANAVNGVINVITRSAAETLGALATARAGARERGGAVRLGTELGTAAIRFYGRYSEFDNTTRADGTPIPDNWNRGQVGFRADWKAGDDTFTLQGDAYKGDSESRGSIGAFKLTPIDIGGVNLLGRWQRLLEGGAQIQLQTYVDHTSRDDALFYKPKADIVDLDLQYSIPGVRHHVLWGAGYRYAKDDIDPGFATIFVPSSRTLGWGNVFVQDEIHLATDLDATLGIKAERNDFTGVEFLPSARLAWKVSPDGLLWGSLSRAVRAPSRYDRDVRFPGFPPYYVVGGPDFRSEVANVIEAGYRGHQGGNLSYSIAAFAHLWDRLRSGTSLPVVLENKIEGTVAGVEGWAEYRPAAYWKLTAGATWIHEDLRLKKGSTDPVGVDNPTLRNDPEFQFSMRSGFELPHDLQLDLELRHIGTLPQPVVPAYTELNARLAWLLDHKLEFALVGSNLLHGNHAEYGDAASSRTQRSIFGQVRWEF